MAHKIGMLDGEVYGEKVSLYGREHGFLHYRTMARIVGDMVLCNGGFRFGLTVNQWKRFLEEVPEAMKQLGVKA